jgi:hypothetical protein
MPKQAFMVPVDGSKRNGAWMIVVGEIHGVHPSPASAQAAFDKLAKEGLPEEVRPEGPADAHYRMQGQAAAILVVVGLGWFAWDAWLRPLLRSWGWW